MALAPPIQLRLDPLMRSKYETEAANREMSLSTYIREVLENLEVTQQNHEILRSDIALGISDIKAIFDSLNLNPSNENNAKNSILIELLLLMRLMANPEKITMAQADLKRLGLPIWNGTIKE